MAGSQLLLVWLAMLAFLVLLAACQKGLAADPQVTRRGEALYNANCLSCHGGVQGDTRAPFAPPHTNAGHTWHHPDGQLKDIILNGFTARGEMPPFRGKLNEADVEAILAYIKTWWGEKERAYQSEVTRQWEAQRRPR
ncbi:MAG: c-type cytochrome [Dehalococcoidia bacterium]